MQPSDGERNMQAELQLLEAHYQGLQMLVSELLVTNQELRNEVARLKQGKQPSATATHPPPHPAH